ncbi:lactonase family protein [Arthrobacter russicus]|uniref:6-phosphogluconolactonase n=1 Tax=Arthrobacter russicus TaxID=172040 RepID=A0ABU1JC42_9MICC|nr:beta-propeller fold lactonase family protein [Arthrobacter russicus]MDR6268967.1 6-phosphogluconolactonase [Arthrobacter russicus]
MELLVGSYTSGSNRGQGISAVPIGEDGLLGRPRLLAEVPDPSFLALADDGVYAVLERGAGQVVIFERDAHDGSLALVAESPEIGADPCHLALLCGGRIIAANYTSGSVVLLRSARGLEPQCTLQLTGSGPIAERQEASHAHQAVPTPYGTVLVSDLGSDSVRELRPGDEALPEEALIRLPPGTGPRHLVLRRGDSADQLLVVGELDGALHVFSRARREAAGGWQYAGRTPLATRESVGKSYPAHIELSAAADLAYVSVRGQDQISVFRLADPAGGNLPELIQETPTGGAWPRHFALGSGVLYAANQKSDSITVFAVLPDGMLGGKQQEIGIGTPVCLQIG